MVSGPRWIDARSVGPLGAVAVAVAAALFVGACGSASGPTREGGSLERSSAAQGKVLVEQKGCTSCHSIDGTRSSGPTFLGLSDSTVELVGGRQAVVDHAYLVRALSDPAADQRAGYGAMPPVKLSTDEIDSIVDYLHTLSASGTTPTSR